MKAYIYNLLVFALVIVTLGSCKGYDKGYYDEKYYETNVNFLTLRNYSSDATVWFVPDVEYAENLPSELSEWQRIAIYDVDAHSSGYITFDSNDNYVTPVETYGVGDKMVIYVFKKDVWEKYEWPEIVAGKMWCGKCSLSVEDARELNGIITYPMR